MYAHIQLGVHDLTGMTGFYDAVLSVLGWTRTTELRCIGPAGVVWQPGGRRWPQFVINRPLDGRPPSAANGSQVSFLCASRAQVEQAWSTALAHGASDEGAPGLRERYAPDFYASYCRDPEGHKLCFVHTFEDPRQGG